MPVAISAARPDATRRSRLLFHFTRSAGTLALALTLLSGCKSKQDEAIDQARKQAAATGQAQQVVSTDSNGNVITTTVQPPAPGQTAQTVTTTVAPPAAAGAATGVAANTPARAGGATGGARSYDPAAATNSAGSAGPYANGANGAGTNPAAPAAGANPTIRPVDVRVPAGTTLAIRINQHISVKTNRAGDRFTGEVVEPITDGNSNSVLIPRGTPVEGVLDASHRRGHFKGSSILELRLTSMSLNGTRYGLDTHDLTKTKKGKGKRSAAFIGGGTGLGMLIGGVATGGVGLVVGGLAGAGAGTGIAGLTGNRDLDIPSESIVHFRLADDLVVQPQ